MRKNDSAIALPAKPISSSASGSGVLWGLVGTLAFSFTVPLTRIAVLAPGLPPLFVGAGRAVVAGGLAAIALLATRQPIPRGRQWIRLSVVGAGVVFGFPVLTTFALTTASASHSAVVIGLLPAATAVVAVFRSGERPGSAFWIAAGLGATCAVLFAMVHGGGFGGLRPADLLVFGAVLAAAVAYAEGGLLARELGAWQTISWALVVAAPAMVTLAGFGAAAGLSDATAGQWAAFAYLGLVSMFLGFFAWYRGLAIGPMTTVSQVQLVQPVFGLVWAALLLGERIGTGTAVGAVAVIGCAACAVRTRRTRVVVR